MIREFSFLSDVFNVLKDLMKIMFILEYLFTFIIVLTDFNEPLAHSP